MADEKCFLGHLYYRPPHSNFSRIIFNDNVKDDFVSATSYSDDLNIKTGKSITAFPSDKEAMTGYCKTVNIAHDVVNQGKSNICSIYNERDQYLKVYNTNWYRQTVDSDISQNVLIHAENSTWASNYEQSNFILTRNEKDNTYYFTSKFAKESAESNNIWTYMDLTANKQYDVIVYIASPSSSQRPNFQAFHRDNDMEKETIIPLIPEESLNYPGWLCYKGTFIAHCREEIKDFIKLKVMADEFSFENLQVYKHDSKYDEIVAGENFFMPDVQYDENGHIANVEKKALSINIEDAKLKEYNQPNTILTNKQTLIQALQTLAEAIGVPGDSPTGLYKKINDITLSGGMSWEAL